MKTDYSTLLSTDKRLFEHVGARLSELQELSWAIFSLAEILSVDLLNEPDGSTLADIIGSGYHRPNISRAIMHLAGKSCDIEDKLQDFVLAKRRSCEE